ncbi:hypothetical protein RU639_002488 [Aspergillus parasiticus]
MVDVLTQILLPTGRWQYFYQREQNETSDGRLFPSSSRASPCQSFDAACSASCAIQHGNKHGGHCDKNKVCVCN